MITSTADSLASWIARQSMIRPQSPRVGSRLAQRSLPPISASASTRCTALKPRLPRTTAHSMPAGPAAHHEHGPAGIGGGREGLGMPAAPVLLPRRGVLHAADVVEGLLPQDADVGPGALADLVDLPSATLRGRNGSAIACLAEPTRSTAPDRITSAIRSGLV